MNLLFSERWSVLMYLFSEKLSWSSFPGISSTLLSRSVSFEYNEAPVASHYRHGQVDRGHWFVSPFTKWPCLAGAFGRKREERGSVLQVCNPPGASRPPNYQVVEHSHSCLRVSWRWPMRIYSFAFPIKSACFSLQTRYLKQLSALNCQIVSLVTTAGCLSRACALISQFSAS